ncbi:MAG: DUF6263 family protein [Pedobacter sp.]
MKTYFSIALLALTAFGCKSQSEKITIKLEKGQIYTQTMSLKSSSEQTISGTKTNLTTLSESSSRLEVMDVKDTVYTLKATFETLSTKMVKDGDTTDNSKAVAGNPTAEILPKMIGKSYTMLMSNRGRILETKGLDVMFDDLFKNMPAAADAIRVMMRKSLASAYGDSAIRKSAEMSSAIYAAKAVKEGDSWPVENSGGNNIMTPKIKGMYTLDKVSSSEYLISNKSTIEVKNNPTPIEMNNMSMKYAVSGTMTSNNKVDRKTGMIMEMKAVQNISGTIILKAPSLPDEMVMPILAKNEITMTTTFKK